MVGVKLALDNMNLHRAIEQVAIYITDIALYPIHIHVLLHCIYII